MLVDWRRKPTDDRTAWALGFHGVPDDIMTEFDPNGLYFSSPDGFVARVLYCRCGAELDGEAEQWPMFEMDEHLKAYLENRTPLPYATVLHVQYYCPECGFYIGGDDAIALFMAFQQDLI